MSKKDQLRIQRIGTIINKTSSGQEREIITAINIALAIIEEDYGLQVRGQRDIRLTYVIEDLRRKGYGEVDFDAVFPTSSMRPDGGIVSIVDNEGNLYPILIAEVKNQGTNDLRQQEGLPPQAKGNAIERLGKNVIGFRTWLLPEDIFPFVCFGYGYDFQESSSIRDRVKTINMFGPLSTLNVDRQGPSGEFQRGSFFFRQEKWTIEEMAEIVLEIMRLSIEYYKRKYDDVSFSMV